MSEREHEQETPDLPVQETPEPSESAPPESESLEVSEPRGFWSALSRAQRLLVVVLSLVGALTLVGGLVFMSAPRDAQVVCNPSICRVYVASRMGLERAYTSFDVAQLRGVEVVERSERGSGVRPGHRATGHVVVISQRDGQRQTISPLLPAESAWRMYTQLERMRAFDEVRVQQVQGRQPLKLPERPEL
ncbi:hypothetical protein DL240_09050 [Lujinxingia litoralis]|uniref:Uncharacterized protein n=1 Tax=Lujinxingia litoralis TaxID=2211119 RepID=A0A328C8T7_9DELT|nr:hypothetical protein [Lujinxingia litoralis]RAL23024.1 hypothetical protein DL240_09050 [Lujinxingia litoralis]